MWHCIKYPNRSLKIVRTYDGGCWVQGHEGGREYGTPYKITNKSLQENWSRRATWFKRLLRLRVKFYFA